jgi:hypothetical protein
VEDPVARFIKKVGPRSLVRALDLGASPRPVSPIRRAAVPLAATAGAVLSLGVARCAAGNDQTQLTPVPEIYLQRLTIDTDSLVVASSTAAPPIVPIRVPPPAGIRRVSHPPPALPLVPEPAHDGPHGVIVQRNEGALR